MSKESVVKFEGHVIEKRPAGRFEVRLTNGHEMFATISGRIRKYNIRINIGDRVDVEMSAYDLSLGRIVYRYKD